MRDLLSPAARRLLNMLSPEPVTVTMQQLSKPQVDELVRFGLIEVIWHNGGSLSVKLSRTGRQAVPSRNN